MMRWVMIGAAIAVALLLLFSLADGKSTDDGWVQVYTANQYKIFMEMNRPTVVLFSSVTCPPCQAIKKFWSGRGIPEGWLFIYWEDQLCDQPDGSKELCGAYADIAFAELWAAGWKGNHFTPPMMVAKMGHKKKYFNGYFECTNGPPSGWSPPSPERGYGTTLVEWLSRLKK